MFSPLSSRPLRVLLTTPMWCDCAKPHNMSSDLQDGKLPHRSTHTIPASRHAGQDCTVSAKLSLTQSSCQADLNACSHSWRSIHRLASQCSATQGFLPFLLSFGFDSNLYDRCRTALFLGLGSNLYSNLYDSRRTAAMYSTMCQDHSCKPYKDPTTPDLNPPPPPPPPGRTFRLWV